MERAAADEFDVPRVIRAILSDGKETPCIFDRFLVQLSKYTTREANDIYAIKRRDNKRAHGLAWEKFCQWYLITTQGYHQAWLLNEIPTNIKQHLKIFGNQDNGIDIVAQRLENGGFIAIQCKYRARIDQSIPWKSLSTFVGMCASTGPWISMIVMTNCKGVSRKVNVPFGHSTIAYGTFKNLTRAQCTMASGTGQVAAVAHVMLPNPAYQPPMTMEEMRRRRLEALDNNQNRLE